MGVAGDLPRERGLAGAGWSDHRGQRAGAGGDRDVVEQRLVALDGPRQPAYVQTAGGGVGGGFGTAGQGAAVEHQVDVADRDGVAVVEQRGGDTGAVDECAVDAAVVADLGSGSGGHQRGVVSRGQHIGDDDVVVARSTDLRRPGRCLCGPARPQDPQHAGRDVAVRGAGCGGGAHHRGRLHLRRRDGLRRSRRIGPRRRSRRIRPRRRSRRIRPRRRSRCVGPRRRSLGDGPRGRRARRVGARCALVRPGTAGIARLRRDGRSARAARNPDRCRGGWPAGRSLMAADVEGQQRTVGVTEMDLLTVDDVDSRHPSSVDEDAVERTVVDGEPSALLESQHQMGARDQRVGDADVGAQVSTDDDVVAGRKGPCGTVVPHGQRRGCRSAHGAAPAATLDIATTVTGALRRGCST